MCAGSLASSVLRTRAAAHRITTGVTAVSATSAGIHAAFLCGAVISLFAIPAAFFIRRAPADAAGAAVEARAH